MQALIKVKLNYQPIFSLCIDKLFLMENVGCSNGKKFLVVGAGTASLSAKEHCVSFKVVLLLRDPGHGATSHLNVRRVTGPGSACRIVHLLADNDV